MRASKAPETRESACDPHMPPIIYGTAWKKGATGGLVATAIRLGFRGIDTACQPKHYDEAGVGAGVAAALGATVSRADLFLQSKFTPVSGQDPATIPYDPDAPIQRQVAESLAVSLRHLHTDYLDCLVLHSPLPTAQLTLEAWRAMESLVAGGGVRHLGISNCQRLAQLEAIVDSARVKPIVVQNRFQAATGFDRAIRAYCISHGMRYQSFWTLTANPHVLAGPAIGALAARHGRTPAQILFRHLTLSGVVPLTGTRSEDHMREDLAIFDFELSESERATVDSALEAAGRDHQA
jgi:diketogulonate reductase-like aldo/keto reductase